jgi:glutathione S-transferase
MQLIGMLDSPYVRRVAISLIRLGLPFEHRSISVFRGYAEFSAINPVVKAPTLVCDDRTVLMDSTLILDYAETLARPRSLMPSGLGALQQDLRVLGLALAACEKSVQIVYERAVRPPEKRHEPWVARVTGQMTAAFDGLEAEIACRPRPAGSAGFGQAELTSAVVWHFAQQRMPELVPAARCPSLVALSALAESLPEFIAAPHGDGTCRPA